MISEIQGGEFQAGLASGFVAKVGGHYLEGTALDNIAGISILGGLASKAAGGDFLQGAIQAAFVYMYNERGDQPQRKPLKSRSMTEGEKKLARTIFKERINYERIKVIDGAYIPTSRPHVSPSGDIYYPGGSYMSDFSTADHVTKAVFMHELTHVYQYQIETYSLLSFIFDRNYEYTLIPGKSFGEYGLEQQGQIVEDYYLMRHNLRYKGNNHTMTQYNAVIPF